MVYLYLLLCLSGYASICQASPPDRIIFKCILKRCMYFTKLKDGIISLIQLVPRSHTSKAVVYPLIRIYCHGVYSSSQYILYTQRRMASSILFIFITINHKNILAHFPCPLCHILSMLLLAKSKPYSQNFCYPRCDILFVVQNKKVQNANVQFC